MTHDELIAELEKATGPNFRLEALIAEVVYGAPAGVADQHPSYVPKPYTASIDAALTLAPEGYRRLLRDHDGKRDYDGLGGGSRAFANVYRADDDERPMYQAYGPTLAIALCIAALKARASLTEGKQDG